MFGISRSARLSLVLLAALVLAACAPATAPSIAPAQGTAAPQPTAAGEATPATGIGSQSIITGTVEKSQAAQAQAPTGAVNVVSHEDVTTPRTHHGGEYKSVDTSDAVSFHPYLTTDTTSGEYQGLVYTGGLLRLDENTLQYIPNMAESYEISADGLTFTFHLRHGMQWSDGQPITAQDWKWTYDQVLKPDNAFPYLSQLDFIKSYEALDDYTLQMTIKEIYAPALGQFDLITPLPKHVWEKYPWNDPQKNPEINHPTVVSGPYKLTEWKRDQYATFEANDKYWFHGAPNITKRTIEIVPSEDVAYQKMKSGESDTGPIKPENLDEARHLPNINVYEWWPAAATWSYVGLNTRAGRPTADVNVRHALSYAIDKNLMTQQIMLGQAKRQCSVWPETSWVYNPDVPCYDYDPQKALDAFKAAGYTQQNGKLVDKNGQQLKIKLIYGPNTSTTREQMAVIVQDYLGKLGIDVQIQGLEWSSFLQATQSKNPDWDMFLGAWQSTIEPHIMYTIWSKDSIPELNSVAYDNPKVEDLFKQAGATYDTAFRKGKYQEIQKQIADDSPYIFLFYQKAWAGLNKRIQGIKPTALGIGWNAEDWYIDTTAK